MKKILAFSGSNSSASINQHLVRLVAQLATQVQVEVISLRDFEAPMYGIDLEKEQGMPDSMHQLAERFRACDGFILATPEHNGSMPAVLKNTIDWISRIEKKPFLQKPMLLLSTSPGPRGAKSAFDHLNAILPYRGAEIVGGHSVGSFSEKVEDGQLVDPELAILRPLVAKLEAAVQ